MTLPEQAPAPTPTPANPIPATASGAGNAWVWTSIVLGVAATVAIASSVMLWQRLNNIQQQLALQSADSRGQAVEARTLARQAEEASRDTASRTSVLEARVGEVALQRGQLEELIQSLSRNRDDNLVGDLEGAIRFAMQQGQLSGSPDPLVSALKMAQQRVAASAQPRLAPLERAMARDLDRIAASKSLDTAGLLARMDDLLRQVDELPLQNDVATPPTRRTPPPRNKDAQHSHSNTSDADTTDVPPSWWSTALNSVWNAVHDEARSLVRVRRIDYPDAVLLSPNEAFFLRENLKLRIMNARLALLARQMTASRNDLAAAGEAVHKYFDTSARRTQAAAQQIQQLQQAMRDVEIPRANDTLAAIATAAAGR
ncbi:MAG: uroporphyrinogen-III C-methyltransferase [Comamonas sp.]